MVVCASTTATNADTVFSNFGPVGEFGVSTLVVGSFAPTNYTIAMPFTTSQSVYLDKVNVPVEHVSVVPPNVLNVAVYTDGGAGMPGTPLETMTITNAPTHPAEVRSATSLLNPQLTAGLDYWLVLSSNGRFGWALNTIGQSGFKLSTDGGANWQNASGFDTRTVFSIDGTPVPEPATCLLLAVGSSFALAGRRR